MDDHKSIFCEKQFPGDNLKGQERPLSQHSFTGSENTAQISRKASEKQVYVNWLTTLREFNINRNLTGRKGSLCDNLEQQYLDWSAYTTLHPSGNNVNNTEISDDKNKHLISTQSNTCVNLNTLQYKTDKSSRNILLLDEVRLDKTQEQLAAGSTFTSDSQFSLCNVDKPDHIQTSKDVYDEPLNATERIWPSVYNFKSGTNLTDHSLATKECLTSEIPERIDLINIHGHNTELTPGDSEVVDYNSALTDYKQKGSGREVLLAKPGVILSASQDREVNKQETETDSDSPSSLESVICRFVLLHEPELEIKPILEQGQIEDLPLVGNTAEEELFLHTNLDTNTQEPTLHPEVATSDIHQDKNNQSTSATQENVDNGATSACSNGQVSSNSHDGFFDFRGRNPLLSKSFSNTSSEHTENWIKGLPDTYISSQQFHDFEISLSNMDTPDSKASSILSGHGNVSEDDLWEFIESYDPGEITSASSIPEDLVDISCVEVSEYYKYDTVPGTLRERMENPEVQGHGLEVKVKTPKLKEKQDSLQLFEEYEQMLEKENAMGEYFENLGASSDGKSGELSTEALGDQNLRSDIHYYPQQRTELKPDFLQAQEQSSESLPCSSNDTKVLPKLENLPKETSTTHDSDIDVVAIGPRTPTSSTADITTDSTDIYPAASTENSNFSTVGGSFDTAETHDTYSDSELSGAYADNLRVNLDTFVCEKSGLEPITESLNSNLLKFEDVVPRLVETNLDSPSVTSNEDNYSSENLGDDELTSHEDFDNLLKGQYSGNSFLDQVAKKLAEYEGFNDSDTSQPLNETTSSEDLLEKVTFEYSDLHEKELEVLSAEDNVCSDFNSSIDASWVKPALDGSSSPEKQLPQFPDSLKETSVNIQGPAGSSDQHMPIINSSHEGEIKLPIGEQPNKSDFDITQGQDSYSSFEELLPPGNIESFVPKNDVQDDYILISSEITEFADPRTKDRNIEHIFYSTDTHEFKHENVTTEYLLTQELSDLQSEEDNLISKQEANIPTSNTADPDALTTVQDDLPLNINIKVTSPVCVPQVTDINTDQKPGTVTTEKYHTPCLEADKTKDAVFVEVSSERQVIDSLNVGHKPPDPLVEGRFTTALVSDVSLSLESQTSTPLSEAELNSLSSHTPSLLLAVEAAAGEGAETSMDLPSATLLEGLKDKDKDGQRSDLKKESSDMQISDADLLQTGIQEKDSFSPIQEKGSDKREGSEISFDTVTEPVIKRVRFDEENLQQLIDQDSDPGSDSSDDAVLNIHHENKHLDIPGDASLRETNTMSQNDKQDVEKILLSVDNETIKPDATQQYVWGPDDLELESTTGKHISDITPTDIKTPVRDEEYQVSLSDFGPWYRDEGVTSFCEPLSPTDAEEKTILRSEPPIMDTNEANLDADIGTTGAQKEAAPDKSQDIDNKTDINPGDKELNTVVCVETVTSQELFIAEVGNSEAVQVSPHPDKIVTEQSGKLSGSSSVASDNELTYSDDDINAILEQEPGDNLLDKPFETSIEAIQKVLGENKKEGYDVNSEADRSFEVITDVTSFEENLLGEPIEKYSPLDERISEDSLQALEEDREKLDSSASTDESTGTVQSYDFGLPHDRSEETTTEAVQQNVGKEVTNKENYTAEYEISEKLQHDELNSQQEVDLIDDVKEEEINATPDEHLNKNVQMEPETEEILLAEKQMQQENLNKEPADLEDVLAERRADSPIEPIVIDNVKMDQLKPENTDTKVTNVIITEDVSTEKLQTVQGSKETQNTDSNLLRVEEIVVLGGSDIEEGQSSRGRSRRRRRMDGGHSEQKRSQSLPAMFSNEEVDRAVLKLKVGFKCYV